VESTSNNVERIALEPRSSIVRTVRKLDRGHELEQAALSTDVMIRCRAERVAPGS